MRNSKDQTIEAFKVLSEPEITRQIRKEIANDALSILVDAINSTVGGVIITDLKGIIL